VAEAAAPRRAVGIEARALSHHYGRRLGLEPVDFAVAAPGLIALTGPNGSGKSTLMRILAGLLRPTGGALEVRRDGRPWPPEERRLEAGFASPDVTLYDEMSVAENLTFAARARGLEEPAAEVDAAMAGVRLTPRAADRVGALSSGWRQRARLAFALLGDPDLLLLDEPGSHLDEEGRGVIEAVATTLARDRLVVIATNDAREWSLGERRIDLAGGVGSPR
jgi:heme exporter protein A